MKTVVLVVWAVSATAAAVFLALQPGPIVGPAHRPAEPRETTRHLAPDRSGATIEALLAMAVPMPENPGEGAEADVAALLERLDELRKIEVSERRNMPEYVDLRRTLFGLVAWNLESHLAFMEQLKTAEDPDEVDEMLEFLIWNPWVGQVSRDTLTENIQQTARTMLKRDPDVHRRAAAARVLCRYGKFDRADFDFLMDRLEAEPDPGVREVILEEMVVAGREIALTREEAEPFVAHLRRSMEGGDGWMASSIADFSEDPEDFRRLREQLASEKDPYQRQGLVNAFSGDHALVRGRADEARAVLIGVMSDPTEDPSTRSMTRDFLATSFGPMDEASADAVARYDAEQKGK